MYEGSSPFPGGHSRVSESGSRKRTVNPLAQARRRFKSYPWSYIKKDYPTIVSKLTIDVNFTMEEVMSNSSDRMKKWRKSTKERIVASMGGSCVCCQYSKCFASLSLHHLDPEEKEFGLGKIIANPKKWESVIKELRKCVLVCNNCHGEIHWGVTEVPLDAKGFDESYAVYKVSKNVIDSCPICGKDKPTHRKTCSKQCAAKRAGTVNWDNIDLESMIQEIGNFRLIADILDISDGAVRKRAKKLNLITSFKKVTSLKKTNLLSEIQCPECKIIFLQKRSNQKFCKTLCARLNSRKIKRPSPEQLSQDIETMSWCAIGRKYNVSDNGARKWAKKFSLI